MVYECKWAASRYMRMALLEVKLPKSQENLWYVYENARLKAPGGHFFNASNNTDASALFAFIEIGGLALNVVFNAHFFNNAQLCFEIINMTFRVDQKNFEQVT